MTTELEKEFFKTFGIEKSNSNCPMLNKSNCILVPSECYYYQYPKITDRVLLELVCLLSHYAYVLEDVGANSVEELKDCILQTCIDIISNKDWLTQQIQQLFKEGK